MKNELSCEVVRDLLPSYHDGLTSEVTNVAVETHLAVCEDCMEALERMSAPIEPKTEAPQENKTIDFLKKVRRVDRWKLVVACVFVVLVVGLGVKFVQQHIGHYLTYEVSNVTVTVSDGVIHAEGSVDVSYINVLHAEIRPITKKNSKGQSLSGYYQLIVTGATVYGTDKELNTTFSVDKEVSGTVKAVYLPGGSLIWSANDSK
jgi:hypothetical protein